MSSKIHNKKRNVGLLYEFLIRAAASAIVEGDVTKSARALQILKKHFSSGPLHKEFKLFNSLIKAQISSESVASSILREAREAAKDYNDSELNRAKTRLINEINRTFDDPTFWDAEISNYRIYATIGTLISEWRQPTGKVDILKLAEYEDALVKWLTENKDAPQQLQSGKYDGTEKLALRIALKKFNEKYSSLLPEQKELVRTWALSQQSGKTDAITRVLSEVRSRTLLAIDRASGDEDMHVLSSELKEVREKLVTESFDNINDEMIKRFMLYAKLRSELNTKDG